MKQLHNPFVISGYVSPDYFCDREQETARLVRSLINGNNVALISPRRMGKTGLIKNCFAQPEIKDGFHTFFVDIYSTKTLREFVYALSKEILEGLKPLGQRALELFWNSVKSLQGGISFDPMGMPSFNLQLGDFKYSEVTLDEIFGYLNNANRHCIVAIDEFQQIANYPEKNVEALLRTYVQKSENVNFVFAGSQRHVMGSMFTSASRPFYQSVSIMQLDAIDINKYVDFACEMFRLYGKQIERSTVESCYMKFDGITWYVQKMMNEIFSMTSKGEMVSVDAEIVALQGILDSMDYVYSEMLFRLPEKQKELLLAINAATEACNITSSEFIHTYRLHSASSVQSASRILLEKDFVTCEQGVYRLYDRFLSLWLKRRF